MKREPSLHITKANLEKILEELSIKGVEPKKVASSIMKKAKPYSIHTRTVTVSNEMMEKKAKKLVQASRMDTDILASIIYSVRKKLKHRGISLIKPGSRDWGVLKELTSQAVDFCNEFNLTRRYGFLKYIEVGLAKMKKFTLNKFLGMYEGICERYQATIEIEKDPDSSVTQEMYRMYAQRVIENTGIHDPIDDMPEKYVWFVRARDQAEKMNVSIHIYMKAQFEAFDFSKGIPAPVQLTGSKAVEKVIRYCYKNGLKVKQNTEF